MKSIIICGSISASDEILNIQKQLEEKGFKVEIPWGVKKFRDNNFVHVDEKERAQDKKDNDLIKKYYELIKDYDVLLVVNTEKKGITGYIGGNTFLEIAFAHVLDKPVYLLNPLPEISYRDELEAMKCEVINGDLDLIR
jgi:hypothetical protein